MSLQSSCLSLSGAGTPDVHHHSQLERLELEVLVVIRCKHRAVVGSSHNDRGFPRTKLAWVSYRKRPNLWSRLTWEPLDLGCRYFCREKYTGGARCILAISVSFKPLSFCNV